MNEKTYKVTGMHCQSCVANVSESVGDVSGVEAVDVDLAGEKVVVRGAELDDHAIRTAITEAGYQPA